MRIFQTQASRRGNQRRLEFSVPPSPEAGTQNQARHLEDWQQVGCRNPNGPRRPARMTFSLRSMTASRRYVPQPYRGPVLLFKRTGDLTGRYRLKDFGWGEVVSDGLEVFDIEGFHWTS